MIKHKNKIQVLGLRGYIGQGLVDDSSRLKDDIHVCRFCHRIWEIIPRFCTTVCTGITFKLYLSIKKKEKRQTL